MAAPAPAKAGGSTCFTYDVNHFSFFFDRGSFMSGSFTAYRDDDCTEAYDHSYDTDSGGWARAGGVAEATQICNANNGRSDNIPGYRQLTAHSFYQCRAGNGGVPIYEGDDDDGGSSSGSSSSSKRRGSSNSDKQRYRKVVPVGPPTGELIKAFGIKVEATLGLHSGIQFQRRDAAAVGIQSVIDMGVLDVVDVWGTIGGTYEVCFPQAGSIIFLDAATSPRTVSSIDSEVKDGFTCASMDRAGMMVLAQSVATESTATATGAGSATAPSSAPASQLTQCEVTTLYNLNLRSAPSGETILTVIAYQTTLTATQRTDKWFFVSFDQMEGWISSRYVSTWGYCRTENFV